jgi:hypothetical protein
VTELEEYDFPDHFFERDGRLFHSHGNLPYPLPADGPEQAVSATQPIQLKSLIFH